MRDLINLIQNISEGVGKLSAGEINNRPGRFEKFIDKIKRRDPFSLLDGGEVTIDPREAKRFTDLKIANQFKGNISARTTDDREIPLSKFAKTSDFGGGGVQAGADKNTAGKESLIVKPKDIQIVNKNIPAHDLYDEIVGNPILNSTEYGRAVIQLAEYIRAGEIVMLPEEIQQQEKVRKAIVDYAGEYLGVLALLYNETRFPAKDKFIQWLGADIGDLIINFPEGSNNNIADSYASITNGVTNHTLNISSKGTGGGAAPAISGLKIPDRMMSDPESDLIVEFVNICKKPKAKGGAPGTIVQGFEAMDLIYANQPTAIQKKFHEFLPWSETYPDIARVANQSIEDHKAGRPSDIPQEFARLTNEIKSKTASPGGKLAYLVKKEVANSINTNEGIPGFQNAVLEILEMNFMQQYTDYKAGVLTFATQWPAKLNGIISCENKCSAQDPKAGGLCFKLGRSDSDDSGSAADVGGQDEVGAETDFLKGADAIASGRKSARHASFDDEPVVGIGREKRKR